MLLYKLDVTLINTKSIVGKASLQINDYFKAFLGFILYILLCIILWPLHF